MISVPWQHLDNPLHLHREHEGNEGNLLDVTECHDGPNGRGMQDSEGGETAKYAVQYLRSRAIMPGFYICH